VTYTATGSSNSTLATTTSGATLNIYLENPAQIAPGTLIQILGNNLCDSSGSADFSVTYLPVTMNNCSLYVDGVRAPLLFVSPTQINAEMPIEFTDRTSVSLYLRTVHADGTVTATTPIATTIVPQNPGIFALGGIDPRPGIIYHASSQAFDIVDVNGLPQVGDTATLYIGPAAATDTTGTIAIPGGSSTVTGTGTDFSSAMVGGYIIVGGGLYTIASVSSATSLTLSTSFTGTTINSNTPTILYGGKAYSYTETATDTIATVTAGLAAAVNNGPDPYVYAVVANEFNRIVLYSYEAGPAGEGVNVFGEGTTTTANAATGSQLTISAYNPTTCCDAPANLPVTKDNPAIPGEALYILATGLGPTNPNNIPSGLIYRGGNDYPLAVPVDSILAEGLTATAMNIALVPGTVGVYYVEFAIGSGVTSNALAQLTIAQQLFVSNVVTFPVVVAGTTLLPPTIMSITPAAGPLAGGTVVTITGTNLLNVETVTFGGLEATSFGSATSTSITATVPGGLVLGPVSVIVTAPTGSNAANTLYTYVAVPAVTSISPNTGKIAGGTTVTISGTGLTGATDVSFGGIDAPSFTVVNDTTITAVTPPSPSNAGGVASVTVVTPGGNTSGTLTFNYSATAANVRPTRVTASPRGRAEPSAQ
jgi:uncharacterized protein (TIGR03437 family)